jgi:hypothetical protein
MRVDSLAVELGASQRRRTLDRHGVTSGRPCHTALRSLVLGGMILFRFVMIVIGASLIAGGLGLTMVGVFAFIGIPMLILGLGLVSAGTSPRS